MKDVWCKAHGCRVLHLLIHSASLLQYTKLNFFLRKHAVKNNLSSQTLMLYFKIKHFTEIP